MALKSLNIDIIKKGAAQPFVSNSDLAEMLIPTPGGEISSESLISFTERVLTPIFERLSLIKNEIKVLTDLRDTLLPRLISGELQVPDAEKFLEEAGI